MLEFNINKQIIDIVSKIYLASGSQDYITANFTFDSDWDDLIKTAVFYQDKEHIYNVILQNDTCMVPYEVLTGNGYLYVGVFGVNGTKRITTNIQTLNIFDGSYGDGITPSEPTEDIYAQIIGIMNTQKADSTITLESEARTLISESNAKTSEDNAKKSEINSKESENNAKESENNAKESETNAGEEADRALNNILNGVSTHNQDITAHSSLIEDIRTVEAIARGRATGYVFDTYQDMIDWLAISTNIDKLVVGDNLYIRDIGVKDYWWDGETYQELEAESPDLTNYYTKEQTDSKMPILITRADYDILVSAGTVQADRLYDIIEE